MKIWTIVAVFSCMVAGTALGKNTPRHVEHGPAGIVIGETLPRARAKLLRHGWTPIEAHANDEYEYSGAELQLVAHGIREVDSCSSDSARCILYYATAGACLRMDTIGEKVNDMRVTRWAAECPRDPGPHAR